MLKPGVVNRRIVGEIISRLERKGLQLVGMKMLQVSDATAASHYAEHVGKSFYQELVDYITSGPVVAMAWLISAKVFSRCLRLTIMTKAKTAIIAIMPIICTVL